MLTQTNPKTYDLTILNEVLKPTVWMVKNDPYGIGIYALEADRFSGRVDYRLQGTVSSILKCFKTLRGINDAGLQAALDSMST